MLRINKLECRTLTSISCLVLHLRVIQAPKLVEQTPICQQMLNKPEKTNTFIIRSGISNKERSQHCHLSSSIESFAERRLLVIVRINNDLVSTEEDDVVKVHVPDVDHSRKKDVSISGSSDGEILYVAISVSVSHVGQFRHGRNGVVSGALKSDSRRMGCRIFGVVVVVVG